MLVAPLMLVAPPGGAPYAGGAPYSICLQDKISHLSVCLTLDCNILN